MAITKYNGILFGGDYCPEQWSEDVWQKDIEAFKEYHVNAVTLNVHSWCVYQPVEGAYDFSVMDKIVRLLTENGIQIVMATGTAALPNWMLKKYPKIMSTHIDGVRNKPGKRVNYCPNSTDYLREIRKMCEALAEHYRNQENIILWHLSNELEDKCYCDACAGAYREWLKKRYGTLKALNERWNTMFWGHLYSDWEEINPPTYANMVYQNVDGTGIDLSAFPTETIEYLRFMSESYARCFEVEKAAILTYIPDALVTNNFQYRNFNYDTLAKPLDVVSYDTYPDQDDPDCLAAFQYDLSRGINGQKPFLIMEMSPNHASWAKCVPTKRPGQVTSIAMEAIARGAESSMFFQIRRSCAGYEKYHGAMISHSGRTDTRVGRELTDLGISLEKLGTEILGSNVRAKVAVIFDWDCRWGLEIPSGLQKTMKYQREVLYYYQWFFEHNIMTDVVRARDDLSGYGLVVAPMLYMLEKDEAENIRSYVEQGGIFLTTYLSGIADKTDRVWLGGYPALLRDVVGLWVEETDALKENQENHIRMEEPSLEGIFRCGFLCDVMHLETARALGNYGEDYYAGLPCIAENDFGKGKALYLGTKPEMELLGRLLERCCREAGIAPELEAPEGVQCVARFKEGRKYLFVLNRGKESAQVELAGCYEDILNGGRAETITLPVYGVGVYKEV